MVDFDFIEPVSDSLEVILESGVFDSGGSGKYGGGRDNNHGRKSSLIGSVILVGWTVSMVGLLTCISMTKYEFANKVDGRLNVKREIIPILPDHIYVQDLYFSSEFVKEEKYLSTISDKFERENEQRMIRNSVHWNEY